MDSGYSTTASSIPSSGVHHEKLNAMMRTMKEHCQTRSESTHQKLLQDFNYLESSRDCTVLDTSTMFGAQFHSGLHDLLMTVENSNPLVWKALSLLQKSCIHSNSVSHFTLSYRYIPFLGRLLTEDLTPEKKLRLLSLLQIFTYGIRIEWQEAYLKSMLRSLSDIVTSSNANEATLALSTIVNLLHRNPAVVCTFLRCVPTKNLLKQVINRDSKSPEFRLEVCKFMILMSDVTESHPDEKELKKFIGMTFQTVVECVCNGNLSLIQHNVNFFGDITQMEKLKQDLLAYPSYELDINSVILLLEGDQLKRGCESILLQFLNYVVCLHPPKINVLLARIAAVASKIIRSREMSARASALALLLSLSQKSVHVDTTEMQAVNQELFELFPVLVDMVNEGPRKEAITLLKLLCECTNVSTMKKALSNALDPNMLRALFEPLMSDWHEMRGALTVEDATFYVEALSLCSKFAAKDAAWLQQFSFLLQQKSVQFALATALKSAPSDVKCSVLKFPTIVGCSATFISGLAQCLSELETSCVSVNDVPTRTSPFSGTSHLFGITEQYRLDNILSRLEKVAESQDSTEVPLTDLMTVFEYRMAEDAREQKILNTSLGAANDRIFQLMQRVNTLKEENVRFRQCFLNSQHCLEQTKVERDTALASEESAKTDAKRAFRESEELKREFEVKVGELQQLNKSLDEKNKQIQKQASQIQTQQMEIASLEETNKANLQQLTSKDEEIKEKDSQIRHLEVIKNAIYEISGGTKKVEK